GVCCRFVVLLQAYTLVFTCTASANIFMFTVLQTDRRNYMKLNSLKKGKKRGFFFNFHPAAC
ncbi:MAG: hypothetical protein LGB73_06115, partial [Sulfurovum sp.]|nr:hypothetical protein [Sulfurovum sp.]